MDYAGIRADETVGTRIGRWYTDTSPFVTTVARMAYTSFALQVKRQYQAMTLDDGVSVRFVQEDPYKTAAEMAYDVNTRRQLLVYSTQQGQEHPILSANQNNRFRAIHDYYGHHGAGNGQLVGFDRHGEEAAWVRHSEMFYGTGRMAMTTETRGQSSAFIWINRGDKFPPQKALMPPEWVMVR